jgi:plastocyanin
MKTETMPIPDIRRCLLLALALAACAAAQAREIEVSQKGKAFQQQKANVQSLKVQVGDTVNFRNDDPFFHNIFSSSQVKSFDLGSFPQGQARKVTFEKEGEVEVECAIHPEMKLRVEVSK